MAALALLLAACTSAVGTDQQPGFPAGQGTSPATQPASSQPSAVPDAVITTSVLGKAGSFNPITPISVKVAGGTLTSVTLVNSEGTKVTGKLADDSSSWQSTEVLGYSKTYRLTAVAANGDGKATVEKKSFTTLTPSNMTQPYLDTIYGSSIEDGATYGVGMIPVVHFDEWIPNKAAAEKALHVTTTPHVDGSWYWTSGQDVHWRPQEFYAPGTEVTVSADVYGVNVGGGMYGQSDQSISYRIGQKRIAIADASTYRVKVYFANKLVRTMLTSMGRGGIVPGDRGQNIYLWTMPGTYTVLGHENPATMSSDSYGLPADSPAGYAPEKVPFATKISTDGIYLHELDATVWAQGNSNLSHGCLNLNYDNASWYYNHSRVGDIVKVVNSGGPTLQLWQGGDWTLSWSQWQKGSALN